MFLAVKEGYYMHPLNIFTRVQIQMDILLFLYLGMY